ncbi:hypothetical protein [Hydrococcus rivularis]|uniref:hypothetical protein n=1 Tax=Hydrococcus rivularis TaxID=1616834 RepID=UPI000AC2C88C|nr:hypothetical protein [Hydrococcus rivularis]
MTEMVDRPHPQPLSQTGKREKDVDRENLKIGIIPFLRSRRTLLEPLQEERRILD